MSMAARLLGLRVALTGRIPGTKVVSRMAGAGHSRLTEGWNGYLQSVDEVLRYQIETLRWRARQLVEDNGEAQGLLLDFESDIVGSAGALLQFRAEKPRGGPLDALNNRIEKAFRLWGMRGQCTLDGFDDFASLQRLAIRTVIVDGEFFALKHRGRPYTDGYALQPIDADQVDARYNRAPDANGVQITMGVETDRYGRPLFYHIWDGHPSSNAKGVRRRVPAGQVLHVFKRVRPGQTRGMTWFAAALVTWKLGDQYTESELVQSMLAAAQGGFFTNKEGTAGFPTQTRRNPETGLDEAVPIEIKAEPGVGQALPPGWEFQPWQPLHPTANYVGFMKAVKRVIARAFGRSYASLTGDLSDVSFSSMRTDRLREMDQNKLHQEDLLVRQFTRPVFADWFVMADASNRLGVLPAAIPELLQYASWMCRGWPWVDPLKDVATAELELKLNINSEQRLCAQRGLDFYDVVNERADAIAYCQEKNVPMSDVFTALQLNAGDQNTGDTTTDTTTKGRTMLRISA